jgi:ParB-like nuclease domain
MMEISAIKIGQRHRQDMGDIEGLAQSIAEIGLLHPIVVTPSGKLIAGARRIQAFRKLGRSAIPATVIDLTKILCTARRLIRRRRRCYQLLLPDNEFRGSRLPDSAAPVLVAAVTNVGRLGLIS